MVDYRIYFCFIDVKKMFNIYPYIILNFHKLKKIQNLYMTFLIFIIYKHFNRRI